MKILLWLIIPASLVVIIFSLNLKGNKKPSKDYELDMLAKKEKTKEEYNAVLENEIEPEFMKKAVGNMINNGLIKYYEKYDKLRSMKKEVLGEYPDEGFSPNFSNLAQFGEFDLFEDVLKERLVKNNYNKNNDIYILDRYRLFLLEKAENIAKKIIEDFLKNNFFDENKI